MEHGSPFSMIAGRIELVSFSQGIFVNLIADRSYLQSVSHRLNNAAWHHWEFRRDAREQTTAALTTCQSLVATYLLTAPFTV